MNTNIDLVIKIGSMALINKDYNDIDYNIISRLAKELKPGMILVSSGATEIGRLDYIKRNGGELTDENPDEIKTDYASQGQTVLMANYRNFIESKYSVRQILVEYTHFNNDSKREHLRRFFARCPLQNAIPIVNYNDAVSFEENRKMEIKALLSKRSKVVECVDNDETASQIATLVSAKTLVILTSVDGIYANPADSLTLIKKITAKTPELLAQEIERVKACCHGSSRVGANGAGAKLEYVKEPACKGTKVIIANSKYPLSAILSGSVGSTVIGIE